MSSSSSSGPPRIREDFENPYLQDCSSPKRRRSTHNFLIIQIVASIIVFIWTGLTVVERYNKLFSIDVGVSSFNVSSNPNFNPSWESKLALTYAGLTSKDFNVSYDGQARLDFKKGYISTVHVATPSSIYVTNGQEELHVEANFTIDEALSHDREVVLDLSIEANSTELPNGYKSYLEITSFVMIDCHDLRIEFSENPRLGKLSPGWRSCRVERCASKEDALHGKSKRCRILSK